MRKRAMNTSVFERKFRPMDNEDETTVWEWEDVHDLDCHYVWTRVESGSGSDAMYLLPGFHIVNKIDYVRTEVPWTETDDSDGLTVKWD